MKNIKILSLAICIWIFVFNLKGQNGFYIKIHDDIRYETHPDLNEKAFEISNMIDVPEGSPSFKVLSAEEYFILGHQTEFDQNQFSSTINNLIANGPHRYFLLFHKYFIPQNNDGLGRDYTVHYNVGLWFPPAEPYSSARISGIQNGIQNLLREKMNSESGSQYLDVKIADAELAALEYLKTQIECIQDPSADPNCEIKINLNRFKIRKHDVQIGGNALYTAFGQDNIYDYFGKKILIDGFTEFVDIADEVRESKIQIDAGMTVVNEDTTLTSGALSGRVYILTQAQFVNNGNGSVWDEIVNSSKDFDYTECWIVLEKPNGKTELYSVFTIGEFVAPSGAVLKGDNQGDRSASVSPWGLALKALGNAALYACTEAVINRLTDEKINDWTTAFKSVSVAGAAWEGVTSLVPWKKTKLDNVMIAISNGLGVVIEKASKGGSTYTVNQGLSDFMSAVGSSILTQFLGPKITERGPKIIAGLTRLVKNSSNHTVNKISGKCFSTLVMNYGCFTENTPVYINKSSQKKISDINIGDFVLSAKIDNSSITASNNSLQNPNFYRYKKGHIAGFVSLDKKHSCEILLNSEEMKHYGVQNTGDLAWLSMPEQGISGAFEVTSLKHYYPTKKPEEENLPPGFVISPVSAIFAHVSDDVWKLTFDKDEIIEVTSTHPFLHADGYWVAAGNLKGGDQIRTKDGYRTLTSIEKLEGSHTVYNITVAGTHTYLVGQDGLVVHNTCGNLDDLANRFINNFSKAIKKNEIDTWWATGYPKFFKRGTFFEKLMARSAKYSRNLGWTHTSHTQDVIDFFKKSGNKYEVVSMKTTYQETVSQWMSSNSVHLTKLNDLNKKWVPNNQSIQEIRKLHIYVKDNNLSNYSSWIAIIKAKYINIDVEFSSIEKEFNL